MGVMRATYENHMSEIVGDVLPDVRAALARPNHADADALMKRAEDVIDATFPDQPEVALWVLRTLVGVAVLEPVEPTAKS